MNKQWIPLTYFPEHACSNVGFLRKALLTRGPECTNALQPETFWAKLQFVLLMPTVHNRDDEIMK